MVKNSAILFSPDDATPPTALTEWLARQADVVLTIRHVDDLMAVSLRGCEELIPQAELRIAASLNYQEKTVFSNLPELSLIILQLIIHN